MIFTPGNCKLCGQNTTDFLPQFELVKCNNCEFIFYKHPLEESYLRELYDKLYNKQEDYSAYKMQADQLQRGEQPHLGYDKNQVLKRVIARGCKNYGEIGAGVGIVGKYLQSNGLQYQGIELDEQAATLAKQAGVNVENQSFEYLSNFSNKDCMLAFEVIEHINDLKHCLQLINGTLKQDGIFGFTVPNFKKHYNQSKEKQKTRLDQVGPPVHINFFTTENISKILPQFGFEVEYLTVRSMPPLNLKRPLTYKRLGQMLLGKYNGPTILCIARKKQ